MASRDRFSETDLAAKRNVNTPSTTRIEISDDDDDFSDGNTTPSPFTQVHPRTPLQPIQYNKSQRALQFNQSNVVITCTPARASKKV